MLDEKSMYFTHFWMKVLPVRKDSFLKEKISLKPNKHGRLKYEYCGGKITKLTSRGTLSLHLTVVMCQFIKYRIMKLYE